MPWTDDPKEAIKHLKECIDEMERRRDLYKLLARLEKSSLPPEERKAINSLNIYNEKVSSSEQLPWWLVVLEEYSDLTSDDADKKIIEKHVNRLAQKARFIGIHIIVATQNPQATVISSVLRSNLPAQLALKCRSNTESDVIMSDSGAEKLNGKGDALYKQNGITERLQCAIIDELYS